MVICDNKKFEEIINNVIKHYDVINLPINDIIICKDSNKLELELIKNDITYR